MWGVLLASVAVTAADRDVLIRDGQFVNATTGSSVLLVGANVVWKGPPWIPDATGDVPCGDLPSDPTSATSCQTFNVHDARKVRGLGYNFIRLGVTWAGGQPTNKNALDPAWVQRLHAVLDVCHAEGIAVVLDIHQDAVGSAVCGEGVPMWFSQLAIPDDIGKPLSLLPKLADNTCGHNDTTLWAQFAGDPDYNIKNPCCRKYNQGSWGELTATSASLKTMDYLLRANGRSLYARYTGLLAAAVQSKPAAVGIELMNEPPSINRAGLYTLWEECYRSIRASIPADDTLAVGIMDPGQASLGLGNLDLTRNTITWLKSRPANLFYAFHWYGEPAPVATAVKNAVNFAKRHGMPSLLTEYGGYGSGPKGGCTVQSAATSHEVGSGYWHYNDYCWPKHCPGGKPDGYCPLNLTAPRWGACITGCEYAHYSLCIETKTC